MKLTLILDYSDLVLRTAYSDATRYTILINILKALDVFYPMLTFQCNSVKLMELDCKYF